MGLGLLSDQNIGPGSLLLGVQALAGYDSVYITLGWHMPVLVTEQSAKKSKARSIDLTMENSEIRRNRSLTRSLQIELGAFRIS